MLIAACQRYGVTLLRFSIGLIFVWFGTLKLVGASPVQELVSSMSFGLPPQLAVILLGCVEVSIGLGLILHIALRLVLMLFALQMTGTFLTLLVHPTVAFQQGNLLLPTFVGEFTLKNLVLIASGIVIAGTLSSKK